MLVLRSLVQDGVVPLLGPPTSIGDVHHGAWYYYLLSPAACLTGGDSPLAVVGAHRARRHRRRRRHVVAGAVDRRPDGRAASPACVMAVSIAAIDESTFIWNPNLIALSSAVALAAAWQAWRARSPGWWVVAAIGVADHDAVPRPRRGAAADRGCGIPRSMRRRRELGVAAAGGHRLVVFVARLPAAGDQRADDRLLRGRAPRSTTSPAMARARRPRSRSASASSACGSLVAAGRPHRRWRSSPAPSRPSR